MDLTVIAPRKDMGDRHRNMVQNYTRANMGDVGYVTGWYPHRPADGPWSMSRAINAGRVGVTTPYLLLTPADYLISADVTARIVEVLADHPWWNPFHSVRQIPQRDTLRLLAGGPDNGRGDVWPMCIAATVVRTEVFDEVGGMDNRFQGWGPEDAALRVKLKLAYGEPPLPEFQCAELWCDRPAPVNNDVTCAMYAAEYMTAVKDDLPALIERGRG